MSTRARWCVRTGVRLGAARRGARVPALARWLLGLGIMATLAANIAYGLGQGAVGLAVGAGPAVALVGSYELLMVIIRGNQVPAVAARADGDPVVNDPLGDQAVLVFAADLAAEHVASIRAIRAQLHVGQPRAQRLRDFLAAGTVRRPENLAA
jgi:hypothetical protein